jgi:hypothetical protein
MIGRATPDRQEVKVLFGLARQLRWIAAKAWGQPLPAEDVDDSDEVQPQSDH